MPSAGLRSRKLLRTPLPGTALRSYGNVRRSRLDAGAQSSNQTMQQLLRSRAIQGKLTVSTPGDQYEQEADRVADQVMRMPQDGAPRIQRMCSECEEEELQRKENEATTKQVSAAAESQVRGLEGGHPLPSGTKDFFESRFARDFSDVQLHTDTRSAATAASINARAYTYGNHIVVASGQYSPDTTSGKQLLAHELAHVVQQNEPRAAKTVQRQTTDANPTTAAGCDPSPSPPASEQWSANPTLNQIRTELPGDNRVLVRRGQTGEAVQLVQQALVAWGCDQLSRNLLSKFGADGDFGSETDGAVREFQSFNEIAVDGLVGPITLSRLDAFVGFGEIPQFPPGNCKVIPPDAPREVVNELAQLGFVASPDLLATTTPSSQQAFAANIAGIPILCDIGKKGGGGKGSPAPPGICSGKALSVAKIGNATFALCDFINASRMTAGAVPHPGAKPDQVGSVEMRAVGINLFATVGSSLPNSGPGSAETDWQHGFIQTVRNLKWTATYQRGWSAVREVATPRRDALTSTVPEPWNANQAIPGFQIQLGKQVINVGGPIALGPEFIGTDPVGIMDDPLVLFADTVPINQEPVCPCSHLEKVAGKGTLDTWVVVTPNGKGQVESDLAFLRHAVIEFDVSADQASGFAVTGAPTMKFEDGKGKDSPVLTGQIANEDLKKITTKEGLGCPVTIPGIDCPIKSPPKKKGS